MGFNLTDKISRFPVTTWQRIKNRRGKRSVSCEVSGRWLSFSEKADDVRGEPWVFVDVMTEKEDGSAHKICELCIPLNQLAEAVSNIEYKK
jgi:hypothetical protein